MYPRRAVAWGVFGLIAAACGIKNAPRPVTAEPLRPVALPGRTLAPAPTSAPSNAALNAPSNAPPSVPAAAASRPMDRP